VKVVKNKVAPPFRHTEFDIMYNQGISFEGDLIDTGIKFEVLKKSGNSIHYGDMKLGAGRESAKDFLKENGKIAKEIEKVIWKKVREAV
jgi:recombination protein RecA